MPTELPNERAIRPGGSMELDPTGEGVAVDETRRLIASSKVEGTEVFDRGGERIGQIHNFMVDKVTGQVAYAVLSFGGFLGIGEAYHPLPWRALRYETRLGGYVVDIDKNTLAEAPRYDGQDDPFADPAYGGRLDDFYGRPATPRP